MSLLSALSLPSQSRFSRHWHLYLYRFGLPLVTLAYMIHVADATNKMDQINGALFGAMFLILLVLNCVWGDRIVFITDIMVALTLWGSLLHSIAQVVLFNSSEGILILVMSAF